MADQHLQLPFDFDELEAPEAAAVARPPSPRTPPAVVSDAILNSSFEAESLLDRLEAPPFDDAAFDDAPFDLEPFDAVPATPDRLPAWATTLGVFDLETTGIDTDTARIVTAHVGVIDEHGAVVERRTWLVDPGVPIPEQATAVHGITTERARAEGAAAAVAVAEIVRAVDLLFRRGLPVVVYNAPYDLSLLAAEARRHGLDPIADASPVVDPLVIDKAVDRFRKGKRTLTAAAGVYGVDLVDAHDAGADAVAAGRVAQAIARRFPEVLDIDVEHLHDSQIAWARDQAASFQDYMRRTNPAFTTSGAWPIREPLTKRRPFGAIGGKTGP